MSIVFKTYLLGVLAILITFLLSYGFIWFFKKIISVSFSPSICRIWSLIGTMFLLVAGIVKLGWSIQTWSGNSLAEKWDSRIFWTLSFIGMILFFTEWIWSYHESLRSVK